jgi:Domain of unknown function (DUF4349)/Putative zinc-finger
MKHPLAQEEVMAYLDGELAPDRAAAAREHLERCRECQGLAADFEGVSRRLLAWEVEAPGERVSVPVDVRQPIVRAERRWHWRRWALAAASACVMLVVIGFLAHPRDQQRPTASQMASPPPAAAIGGDVTSPPREVAHTAGLSIETPDFDRARAAIQDILKRHSGYVGNLQLDAPIDAGRTLNATLRVPEDQLDATMAELRKLGRVTSESQNAEDVTAQSVDLDARLANARATEQRLLDLLRKATGKLTEVLAVEKEIDSTRGEIERMEAERKALTDRVKFATITLQLVEEYKARVDVGGDSSLGRFRNAAVNGFRGLVDSLSGVAVFLLSYGPAILVWAAILFFPARFFWKRRRGVR